MTFGKRDAAGRAVTTSVSRAFGNYGSSWKALQVRADNYRRFLPEWPALWQSFDREAKQLREQVRKRKEKP